MTTIENLVYSTFGAGTALTIIFVLYDFAQIPQNIWIYTAAVYVIAVLLSTIQYEREKIISKKKLGSAVRACLEGAVPPLSIFINLVRLFWFRYLIVTQSLGDKDGIYRQVVVPRFSKLPELAQEWGYSKNNEIVLLNLGYIYFEGP